ncbi:hypothetical protein Q3G72_030984 [Acer saccharum]|nr:hypothetical protein Q3G72_030984 [Acer saccharum]
MAMAKEDVEATMTICIIRGEVALGATENGAKIHGPYDLPPKIAANNNSKMWSNFLSDFDDYWYDQEELEVAMTLDLLRKSDVTGLTEKAAGDGAGTSQTDHDDLPRKLRTIIESLNGAHIALVMEKKITYSDLSKKQNRLSSGVNNVNN